MWLFKKKPAHAAAVDVAVGAPDCASDEHSVWGVGGPGHFPLASLDVGTELLLPGVGNSDAPQA